MSDYISREFAEKVFSQPVTMSMCLTLEECKQKNAQRQIDLFVIRGLPAADVVEVVRCKDCMYCQKDELGRWCFNDYENELRDDDFCSHGKRKESKT